MKQFFKKLVTEIITWEAKAVIRKYKPKVIGITGSVGKTSTKDAVYAVMKGLEKHTPSKHRTRKSDKSFNSEIGIPLTILGCNNAWSDVGGWLSNIFRGLGLILFRRNYPQWLVLEIGADRPGDIKKVTEWLRPDVAIITRFGKVPVHVEFFDSPAQVFIEKSYLAKSARRNGFVILNYDDDDVRALAEEVKSEVITYGMEEGATVRASNYQMTYAPIGEWRFPSGITFKVDHGGNSVPVTIMGGLGRTHVYPALAAIAVGISQEMNLIEIAEALAIHSTPPGRMRLISGNKSTLIIDDTYNSSPVALNEALETLNDVKGAKRKIAVLGDMLEIGKYTAEQHKKAGQKAAHISDILITVGIRARQIADGALDENMSEKKIYQFDDSREAGVFLDSILKEGDVVLVKGSQGTRMERVVEEVMAHPEEKEKLLVRQDLEWRKR